MIAKKISFFFSTAVHAKSMRAYKELLRQELKIIKIFLTLESSTPSKLARVYGIRILIAGDVCKTLAFLLKSSAVSSLRRVQNNSAARSMIMEATRRVMERSEQSKLSADSEEFDRVFDELRVKLNKVL